MWLEYTLIYFCKGNFKFIKYIFENFADIMQDNKERLF